MQLEVNEVAIPERIEFNYTELKNELQAAVGKYETMVYTDSQIKEAKADKAMLNKLKKALNDERIRREREYMAPFNVFKAQVNELIALIDKPIALIDDRVKGYEEEQKAKKQADIKALFDDIQKPAFVQLMAIWNPKWMNVSYTLKAIREEIEARVEQIVADSNLIAQMPEYSFEAMEVYKQTLDYNAATRESFRLAEMARRKAEAEASKKVQAEQKTAQPPAGKDAQAPAGSQEVNQAEQKPAGQWIGFQAYLTIEQAGELRKFFVERGIQYRAIRV